MLNKEKDICGFDINKLPNVVVNPDFNIITKIIEEHKKGLPTEKLDAVTDNLEKLIEM